MERMYKRKQMSEEDIRRAGELVIKMRFLYFEREEAKIELLAIQKEAQSERN